MNSIKTQIDETNIAYQQAERSEGNYAKASEIKYGKLADLEKEPEKQQEKKKKLPGVKTNLVKQRSR